METNNWKYNIQIKHLFEEKTTKKLIETLCKNLIFQLKKIEKNILKSNLTNDEKEDKLNKISETIDHFDFLKDLSDGSIKEKEWEDYCFDGNFQNLFNDYLSELYDLGDERVMLNSGITEKFIWIY